MPSPAPARARISPGAVGVLVALAAGLVLADQVSKQAAVAQLAGAEPVRLLGGAVYLVHATNSGAAFNLGSSYTYVFPVVALAVLGWIVWLARRLRSVRWAVALGLVAGGATGNLVDRLFREPGPFRGHVVDMISVFAPDGSVWPVFNLADAALVVGVVLAVWLELTGCQRDGAPRRHDTSPRDAAARDGAADTAARDGAADSAARDGAADIAARDGAVRPADAAQKEQP